MKDILNHLTHIFVDLLEFGVDDMLAGIEGSERVELGEVNIRIFSALT